MLCYTHFKVVCLILCGSAFVQTALDSLFFLLTECSSPLDMFTYLVLNFILFILFGMMSRVNGSLPTSRPVSFNEIVGYFLSY